jgi:predicted DNA-binding transcriptional regulator AlpA
METQQQNELLGPEAVSGWLGVPVTTLYQWRYRHIGPPSIKVGKHVRYRRIDVDAWLDSRTKATI